MPGQAEHTHHIRLRNTQLEMPEGDTATNEDFDGKLKRAQAQLEQLQQQREQIEKQKQALEELNTRKRTFLTGQIEMSEKLTSALSGIDRELFSMREELDDLEQCRICFAAHLDKLQKYNLESGSREMIANTLERALKSLAHAEDEFSQAADHFENTRSGVIFGRRKKSRGAAFALSQGATEFLHNLRNGLAFNLPVLILGTVALVVWITR